MNIITKKRITYPAKMGFNAITFTFVPFFIISYVSCTYVKWWLKKKKNEGRYEKKEKSELNKIVLVSIDQVSFVFINPKWDTK